MKMSGFCKVGVQRHLHKVDGGDSSDAADELAEEAPALASCYTGSIQQRQTLGRKPGAQLVRVGSRPRAALGGATSRSVAGARRWL